MQKCAHTFHKKRNHAHISHGSCKSARIMSSLTHTHIDAHTHTLHTSGSSRQYFSRGIQNTHTLSFSHTRTLSFSLSHALSLSLPLTHSLFFSLIQHSLFLSHTHTLSFSVKSITLSHAHTYTPGSSCQYFIRGM